MASFSRRLAEPIALSLGDSPVVFLQGARQTGKSTLARNLVAAGTMDRYLTLDDSAVLAAATSDPDGFIAGFGGSTVIDEVQRAPGLAVAIKAAVDRNRRPGRFLLTGSANLMVLPALSESLAGRMEIHTLWPFSQGELDGRREAFLDQVFDDMFPLGGGVDDSQLDLAARMARGGYPEMLHRKDTGRRRAWFDSYVQAILQRDLRDISNVRDLADMPRLLALLASRATGLLDYADIARALSMPQTTLKRYTALLEAVFLCQTLPAWFTNIGKRLVKAPKLLINDTALLLHLLGADPKRLQFDPTRPENMLVGPVLENFVVLELRKQQGWSELRPSLHHFRTHGGDEVDIVVEDPAGRVVGIEVKSTASVTANHFKGLRALAEAAGERFVRGIVLHRGREPVPFGRNLLALPVSRVWTSGGRAGASGEKFS